MTHIWLATDGKRLWPLEHEGDYSDGDVLVCVEVRDEQLIVSTARDDERKAEVLCLDARPVCECGQGSVDEAGYIRYHAIDCPKSPIHPAFVDKAQHRDSAGNQTVEPA